MQIRFHHLTSLAFILAAACADSALSVGVVDANSSDAGGTGIPLAGFGGGTGPRATSGTIGTGGLSGNPTGGMATSTSGAGGNAPGPCGEATCLTSLFQTCVPQGRCAAHSGSRPSAVFSDFCYANGVTVSASSTDSGTNTIGSLTVARDGVLCYRIATSSSMNVSGLSYVVTDGDGQEIATGATADKAGSITVHCKGGAPTTVSASCLHPVSNNPACDLDTCPSTGDQDGGMDAAVADVEAIDADTGTDTATDTNGDADIDADTDTDGDTAAAPLDTGSEIGALLPTGCEGVLVFPDANLEAEVREAIGIPTGDIYYADVIGVTRLNAGPKSMFDETDIVDLTGIECLNNLAYLDLNDNSISDLSALSTLTKLTELDLSYNSISDLSALSALTRLTELDLCRNSISDLSALSTLTNLTYLHLADNSISDLSALSTLTNLTDLYLYRNSVSDPSALSTLTNLKTLYLNDNNISDISALTNLTSLTYLPLSGNSISDISALTSLTSLTVLFLQSNSISDISALSNLTRLYWLDLSGNSISDISALVDNSGINDRDTVRISKNALDCEDPETLDNIAILTTRSVNLSHDCR